MASAADIAASVVPSLDASTRLSFERTRLSAERTLMSWIRTAFSMISFGFTMAKFFEYLSSQPGRRMALGEGSTLPRLLVLLGLVSLLVGMWEFRHVMVQLYAAEGKRRRVTPVGVIAFLVALLGVLAFVGLFVRID